MVDDQVKQQAAAGFAAGKTDAELAQELGKARSTIWRWRQQWQHSQLQTGQPRGEQANGQPVATSEATTSLSEPCSGQPR